MTKRDRKSLIEAIAKEATQWRRELHRHPQTMYEETFAAGLVVERLTEWGIPHETGFAGTGVVGDNRWTIARDGAGDSVLRGHGCVGYCGGEGGSVELDLPG